MTTDNHRPRDPATPDVLYDPSVQDTPSGNGNDYEYVTPTRADHAKRVLRRRLRDPMKSSYIKTKHVAEALGMSTSQTTSVMRELESRGCIELWNDPKSGNNTWEITLDTDD